jgi:hypothetical protein
MRLAPLPVLIVAACFLVGVCAAAAPPSHQERPKMTKSPEVARLIAGASAEEIERNIFFLAKDPLPYRKANYTRPGQTKSTLEEADDFVQSKLEGWGYTVEREAAQVQAFRCDTTKHPSHWYSVPDPSDPTYTAYNLYAKRRGAVHPGQVIVVISHKDSPSWIDCPGANDNAAGTSCNLEVARLLAHQPLRKSVWFIYCNEEHYPWTSITAANNARARGDNVIAVFNLDGSGGESPDDKAAGRHPSSAIYGTPEGERLADLLADVNETYGVGLTQYKRFRKEPGNDDGSYLKAGFPAAIGVHGDLDWGDPAYHRPEDVPERLDPGAIRRVAQLIAAAILTLDQQ